MTMQGLQIKHVSVQIEDKLIFSDLNLTVRPGEIHAIMGPNGAGKSTLSNAIMGHPSYEITEGDIVLNGESILDWSVDERANAGLFLAFQSPIAVPGVTVANFLRTALNAKAKKKDPEAKPVSIAAFRKMLKEKMALLKIDSVFAGRYLNDGFSGGEKKRLEVLQMSVLQPEIAILDEIDSGLDIDAMRIVAEGVNRLVRETGMGVLMITHYQRLLNEIHPDYVHIMMDGGMIRSGDAKLALEIEERGYDWVRE